MKLKSGRVVDDLDGFVGIDPNANEIRYGHDGYSTTQDREFGEYWACLTPEEFFSDTDVILLTQAEREEIAEMMCARWKQWAAR